MGPDIIITENSDELAQKGAALFQREAAAGVGKRGVFAVAVSGGTTPRPMHRRLAAPGIVEHIPWSSVRLFWVDERLVGVHHPDSNYGNARADFLDAVPMSHEHIFPMPYWMAPAAGARTYTQTLRVFFQSHKMRLPVFDLIFLGLGADGHTASLFPRTDSSVYPKQWVLTVKGGHPDVPRFTLNFDIINQARHVCFLVSGAGKAKMVKTVLEGSGDAFPAQKIKPETGRTTWICDQPAAGLLERLPTAQRPDSC